MKPVIRTFISYARRDLPDAERIVDRLRSADVDVLMDVDLPQGSHWEQHLRSSARDADAFVFLVSPASVESAWVMSEIGAAIAAEKPVIPVLLGNRLPPALPAPFRQWHFIRAAKRDPAEVANEIRQALNASVAHVA